MARPFSTATAEQVVSVVEAVFVRKERVSVEFVAEFVDLPRDRTDAALKLATDIGFLKYDSDTDCYSVDNPLCPFVATPDASQKSAVLRILLESYLPFITFRLRLIASGSASTSAWQTKVGLDLAAHRDEIKDTLLSLGTYSNALIDRAAGQYTPSEFPFQNPLMELVRGCEIETAAENVIRQRLGVVSANDLSRESIILPLANALKYAVLDEPRTAVMHAAGAVEFYLDMMGSQLGVSLAGAHGIGQKISKFDRAILPTKVADMGRYLNSIRNAAAHGSNDPDINAPWNIRKSTGLEYVFVACSFIATAIGCQQTRFEI